LKKIGIKTLLRLQNTLDVVGMYEQEEFLAANDPERLLYGLGGHLPSMSL